MSTTLKRVAHDHQGKLRAGPQIQWVALEEGDHMKQRLLLVPQDLDQDLDPVATMVIPDGS